MSLSALSPDGQGLVVAHGSVVWIARRSEGLAPAAVLRTPNDTVAVASSARRVFALTHVGELIVADRSGEPLATDELGGPALDVVVRGRHTIVFVGDGYRRWIAPGQVVSVAVDHVVAGAVDAEGRVAVATSDGTLRVFDAHDAVLQEIPTPKPLHHIVSSTWHDSDAPVWYAASEDEVFVVRADDTVCHHITQTGEHPIRHLAASVEGGLLAVGLGDSLAVIMTLPSRDTVGQLAYSGRTITGLDLDSNAVVGVGLDQGDGNWFELRTRALVRTDPPDGEPRRTWLVSAGSTFEDPPPAKVEPPKVDPEPAPARPAPKSSTADRRPPPPHVDPASIDHVRRCATCGEPAAVPLNAIFARRMGFTTNAVAQLDYRCQHCGTPFGIQSLAEIRLIAAAILAMPLLGVLSAWVSIPFAEMSETTEPYRWLSFLGIGFILFGVGGMVWSFVRPGLTKLRHPKVPDARVPPLRYPRPYRLRRCTCGAWAAVSKVEATTINGIRMSTDRTFHCHECGNEFTVVQPFTMFLMGAIGLALTPFGAILLLFLAMGQADLGTVCCTGGPAVLGLFGLWSAFTGARDRWFRHPLDPDEPPQSL
ncbi:MAG: hypothetical protein AAGA48_36915 [Myxococcota bacterium]